MTAFALRMSAYHNGVSQRHGQVARRMWHSLWPDMPEEKVPIDYVTNGVHVPTWIEPKMELLFNKYLGPQWLADHDNPLIWERVDNIPDEELWQTHYWLKMKLINTIRAYTPTLGKRPSKPFHSISWWDLAGPLSIDHRFCPPLYHL